MFSEHFEAISAPLSAEHFATAMEGVGRASGAERFLVLRLQGLAGREVGEVMHNGGAAVDRLLGRPRSLVFDRLTLALAASPFPSMLIGDGGFDLDIDGYEHGAASLSRDKRFGCIVVLARAAAVSDAERMGMMANASLASSLALVGFGAAVAQACPLRPREVECLRYYMADMSPKQTGQALGISARTVEGHLERARLRLNVDTTLAAAMRALNEGWIEPSEIRRLEAAG